MGNWQSDIDDYSIISKQKAEFILNECKTNLQSHLDTSKELDNKILIILGVLITITTALLGILASNFTQHNWNIITSLILAIILCVYSEIKLILALAPKKFYLLGNSPDNLLIKGNCNQKFTYMLLSETKNYQERIGAGLESNKMKAIYLSEALFIIVLIPVVSIIVFIISLNCF